MPGGSSERFVEWFPLASYAPESTVMDCSDSRHGIWSCSQIQGQLVKLKRRFSNEVNWRNHHQSIDEVYAESERVDQVDSLT